MDVKGKVQRKHADQLKVRDLPDSEHERNELHLEHKHNEQHHTLLNKQQPECVLIRDFALYMYQITTYIHAMSCDSSIAILLHWLVLGLLEFLDCQRVCKY